MSFSLLGGNSGCFKPLHVFVGIKKGSCHCAAFSQYSAGLAGAGFMGFGERLSILSCGGAGYGRFREPEHIGPRDGQARIRLFKAPFGGAGLGIRSVVAVEFPVPTMESCACQCQS